jgi:hypothetical protein
MRKLKLHIAKIFAFVVAVQILNLSIYTQDFQPLLQPSNSIGEFNEFNSVVEYVAEVVLDHENALPEYNNTYNAHKDLQAHKHVTVKMLDCDLLTTEPVAIQDGRTYIHPLKDDYRFLFYKEINPPPPKA